MKFYDYEMSPTESDQWADDNMARGKSMRAVIRANAVEQATKRDTGKTRLITPRGDVLEIISVKDGVKIGAKADVDLAG